MSRFGSLGTQYFDNSGEPLVDGLIYFYQSGTTTLKNTFSDINETIPNANPVVLTASGRQPNIFFSGSAKAVLATSADVIIETRDPVGGSASTGAYSDWVDAFSYSIGDIVTGSNGEYYVSLANGNQGFDPTVTPTKWSELDIIRNWNTNDTYTVDDLVKGSDGIVYRSTTNSNTANDPLADITGANWLAAGVKLTTKGSMLAGDGSNALPLTVGAEGTVPKSRAAAALGIAWEAEGDYLAVGDYLISARDTGVDANLLLADGAVYLQATYPALFAELGLLPKDYSDPEKLANPATTPTGTGNGVAFSSDDTYMSVAHDESPFITIYKRSGDVFTKLDNPATLPTNNGEGVAFSSDDTYMAVAHATSPFVTIYKRDGDTFTKLTNPATLPASTGNDVAFSSDDIYMAVAHNLSPYITIYKRDGDTFTKLADPATLPPSNGNGVAFSSDNNYMSVAHDNSPFITVYKQDGDVFTKLANPATLPTGVGEGVAFSSDDTYMAVAHRNSPFVTIYKRSGDVFTKLDNPATLPASTGFAIAFSSDDAYMAVGHANSPSLTIYKRSGDTFTKLADPATLPPGNGQGVAFSSDDTYMSVVHAVGAEITIYKSRGATYDKTTEFRVPMLPAGIIEPKLTYIKAED